MGKHAFIDIGYFENNYNLSKIYKSLFECKNIDYIDNDYYMVDDEIVFYTLELNKKKSDIFLNAISENSFNKITFSLIIDGIITTHSLNVDENIQVTINVGKPKMIKNLKIPDFTFYANRILPYFSIYEFDKIEFSYF